MIRYRILMSTILIVMKLRYTMIRYENLDVTILIVMKIEVYNDQVYLNLDVTIIDCDEDSGIQ